MSSLQYQKETCLVEEGELREFEKEPMPKNPSDSSYFNAKFLVPSDKLHLYYKISNKDDSDETRALNRQYNINKSMAILKERAEECRRIFLDILESENKYVCDLDIIMTRFKLPLENLVGKGENEVLNTSEIKLLFDNLIPIYEIHRHFYEALCDTDVIKGGSNVGYIYVQLVEDCLEVYPQYITHFHKHTKAMLEELWQKNKKFTEFIIQTSAECDRSLEEQLLLPTCRLSHMLLLINRICGCMTEHNWMYPDLEAARSSICKLMKDFE